MTKKTNSPKKKDKKASSKASSSTAVGRSLFSRENVGFLAGLVLLLASLYILLSLVSFFITGASDQSILESYNDTPADTSLTTDNYAGFLGARIAYYLINDCFGMASVFIPVFFILASMKLLKAGRIRLWKWFANFAFLMIWFSVALHFFMPQHILNSLFFFPGGRHGQFVCDFLYTQVGIPGIIIILLITAIAYFIYLSDETIRLIRKTFTRMGNPVAVAVRKTKEQTGNHDPDKNDEEANGSDEATDGSDEKVKDDNNKTDDTDKIGDTDDNNAPVDNDTESAIAGIEPYNPRLELEYYNIPPLSLLTHYNNAGIPTDENERHTNKAKIIESLHNFGVEISNITDTVGPTVTLYEITPAVGVRIAKIKNLEDDMALSLKAEGIRIIAPMPGKGTIGIEVPNKNPQIVSMESVLNNEKFQNFKAELPIAIGKTITNDVFMFDLVKLPHLLVAGATGQGKSVGLNAIITSLLYRKHPAELKFVLIDPKKVELSIYSILENHFLAKVPDENADPVITDTDRVVYTLESICKEMDTRYAILKRARVRNIQQYNAKFCSRIINSEGNYNYMPYIVVIIDEFADLIMTAGKNIENPITRIAQLARAVGIHMIIATQRPTADIITGKIKSNFTARIAFKVTQSIDSRTIIDRNGADRLIGRGDMLYSLNGEPIRMQCAFVDTPEIDRITNHIAQQQGYPTAFMLPDVPMPDSDSKTSFGEGENMRRDPLFDEAARFVVESGQGSTSLIQRKFSIGYNRAGRITDQLEKMGVVGPSNGSKPRDVLCSSLSELEMKLSNYLSS